MTHSDVEHWKLTFSYPFVENSVYTCICNHGLTKVPNLPVHMHKCCFPPTLFLLSKMFLLILEWKTKCIYMINDVQKTTHDALTMVLVETIMWRSWTHAWIFTESVCLSLHLPSLMHYPFGCLVLMIGNAESFWTLNKVWKAHVMIGSWTCRLGCQG